MGGDEMWGRASEDEGEGEMNDGTLYAIATARRLCLTLCLFRRAGRLSMRRGCTGERLISDVHWLRAAAEPKAPPIGQWYLRFGFDVYYTNPCQYCIIGSPGLLRKFNTGVTLGIIGKFPFVKLLASSCDASCSTDKEIT